MNAQKLSIVIPSFNEEKTIIQILDKNHNVCLPNQIRKEIIIINDCSTDQTADTLSFTQLYSYWFDHQTRFMQQVFSILGALWVFMSIYFIYNFIVFNKQFWQKYGIAFCVFAIGLVGTFFRFFNAPDFRFSAIFLLLSVFQFLYLLLNYLLRKINYSFYLLLIGSCYFLPRPHFSQVKDVFSKLALPSILKVELKKIMAYIRLLIRTNVLILHYPAHPIMNCRRVI